MSTETPRVVGDAGQSIPTFLYPAPFVVVCISIVTGVLCGLSDYTAALGFAAVVAGLVVALSLPNPAPSVLLVWFITAPIATFLIQIPSQQAILTYDRVVLTFVALLILIEVSRSKKGALHTPSRSSSDSHRNGSGSEPLSTARPLSITRFEIVWALLGVVAVASVATKSVNLGYSMRILVDSFWLPLIAFHAVRRYSAQLSGRGLILGVMGLSLFLVTVGAYEFVTGSDLFPYRGAAIVREAEIRVNGPFASDSSYAIICLLFAVFLRIAPRVFGVHFDRGANFAHKLTIAFAIIASLLPLYRIVAVSLFVCWIITEGVFSSAVVARRHALERVLARSKPIIALGLVLIAVMSIFGLLFWDSSIASRITSPRNLFGRVATWEAAAQIASEDPVFGVGLMNYRSHFDDRYPREQQWATAVREARPANYPHSNFLWIASELGVIGLGLYAIAAACLIRSGYRGLRQAKTHRRAAAGGLLALVAAYFIPGLTLTSGAYSDLNLCFFFLIGILSTRLARSRVSNLTGTRKATTQPPESNAVIGRLF
jgi:hypothetical protein